MAWYEANGNVAAIEDAKGVVTQATYNAIGQRTQVNDPNQGTWTFAYNALDEVTSQTDARGITTTLSYDKLSRPTTRTASIEITGDTTPDTIADAWSYDPANAKGMPLSQSRTINGTLERSTTATYDALARPIQSDITQATSTGNQSYRLRTKYDSYYGRPTGQEFPNGEAVQMLYGIYGHGLAEKDPGTGLEYRRTTAVNARGQATQETFGNGVLLTASYQFQTGQLTGLTYSGAGGNLRQLGYGYDVFGNLKRQKLNAGQTEEQYQYDRLHRMVSATRTGAATGTTSYAYDSVGNFSKKSDFSANAANAYVYTGGSCGGGANAVKAITLANTGTRTYCYDANGNLTGDSAGLSLTYDHQNLPVIATRGAQSDGFRYGPDGARTRSWGSDGARVYLPGYEHRTDTGETKVYVGDYAVISRTGSTRKVEYLLKDRLGSVDAVANASGAVIETRGYDAFGKPRSGTWADLAPPKLGSTAVTPKGFTQHEHLNQLELIHMNGRVYDYSIGRFTGVDPFIQFPLNSQSLNPYSYILNNPLSGTDPTGYRSQGSVCDVGKAGNNANGCHAGDLAQLENSKKQTNDRKKRDNGAQGGQTTAPKKREDSKDDEKNAFERIGSALARQFVPAIAANEERGKPGTTVQHLQNAGAFLLNTAVDQMLLANPSLGTTNAMLGVDWHIEYQDEGLATPAALEAVTFILVPESKGSSAAKLSAPAQRSTGKMLRMIAIDSAGALRLASELPVIKRGSKAWDEAVEAIATMTKARINVRTETASDAKVLLQEARGKMDRRKQYTDAPYRKGFEMHNQQSARELEASNDLQHLKWRDGKAGGHIFYDTPN